MKSAKLFFLVAAAIVTASLAWGGSVVNPLQAPSNYSGPGHIPTMSGPQTTSDSTVGIGTTGNVLCPLSGNCQHSGTDNFNAVQVQGVPQNFPPSGNILGASDASVVAGKTMDASQNTFSNFTTANFAAGVIDPDPTLSGNSNSKLAPQAAVKSYVDSVAQGLVYKAPAQLATTANITLSGEQVVDGVLTSASRVLVKDQIDLTQNGPYVSGAGAWTRATDANTGALLKNSALLIIAGSTNTNTTWNCTCAAIVIGTSPIVYVKISGSNVYTAGDGLQLLAGQFSVDNTVTRNSAAQALINKSMNGSLNTFTNIPNGALVSNSMTIAGHVVVLGGSTSLASTDLTDSASITKNAAVQSLTNKSMSGAANTFTNISNGALTNSGITVGGQVTALGGATSNQGNGSKLQLSTGATATNDCAKYDVNGNTVDAGSACATQGGVNNFVGSNSFTGASGGFIAQAQNVLWHRDNPVANFTAPCGDEVSSEGASAAIVLTLPSGNPPSATALFPDCMVAPYASASANPIFINPSPNYIKTDDFDREVTPFLFPGSEGHAGFVLRFAGNGIGWQFVGPIAPPSSVNRYGMHHGAVRYFHDAANPWTWLCPYGDGGLTILRKLTYVPPTCVKMLDSTASVASTFYYVYAIRNQGIGIIGTTGDGSHCPDNTKLCIQFSPSDVTYFASGSPITCVNFLGTPWVDPTHPGANVIDDPNTIKVLSGGNAYIELSDVTYTGADVPGGQTPPECAFTTLKPDGAPVLDPLTEVMVETSRPFETLVGAVYVDASGNVVDSPCERNVVSYFNPLPKQLQCVLATSTTTSAAAYRTPIASFQGQFITFAQPSSAGNISVPWTASMRAAAQSVGITGGLDVVFDHSSRAGNSVCATGATLEAPDKHEVTMTQFQDKDFKTDGITTAALEGFENYMHLCAFSGNGSGGSGGTLNIQGTDEAGLIGPGATVISATLRQ